MATDNDPKAGDSAATAGGNPFQAIYRLMTGYGFAVILISLLFLLTFLGTLEQRGTSLFEVQRKYFESIYLWQALGPSESAFERNAWLIGMVFLDILLIGTLRGLTRVIALGFVSAFVLVVLNHGMVIPLPGAALVMACFFVNLILGGLVRIRKRKATMGVIVAHVGILIMLLAGLVEYGWSTKGHMTMIEGESSDEYVSFNEWELIIFENGDTTEFVIPGELFVHNDEEDSITFRHDALPFQFKIDSVMKNSIVVPVAHGPGDEPGDPAYRLRRVKQETEAELDVLGCVITAWSDSGMKDARSGILWGKAKLPFTFQAGEKLWLAHIQRRSWQVPFTIDLEDARAEQHPGTDIPSAYESDVVMTEEGGGEKILISMNEPLRHRGYTLFQNRMGSTVKGEIWSQFAVVKNPADAWPLYACYVIAAGLLIHFVRKLTLFVSSVQRRSE